MRNIDRAHKLRFLNVWLYVAPLCQRPRLTLRSPVLNPNFENIPNYQPNNPPGEQFTTASGEGCACAPTWGAVPTTAMLTFPQPGVNMQGTCGGPSCPVTMSSVAPDGTDWEYVPFCDCQTWGNLNTQSYSNNPCSGITVTSTATATCTPT